MTSSDPILIAGAGIGGLTAAIALQRLDIPVVVLERAPTLSPVGAGLLLQRNALQALRHIGMMEKAIAAGVPIGQMEGRNPTGTPLMAIRPETVWGDLEVPAVALHRAELHDVLLEAAGPVTQLNAAVRSYRAEEARVVVTLDDGRELTGAALIGADGLRSAVRAQLVGDTPLRYSGQTSWRAITPALDLGPRGVSTEVLGPGLRFGYVQVGGGRSHWYAVRTAPPGGKDAPEMLQPFLLDLFGRWHEPIPSLIRGTPIDTIVRTDIFDRVPVTRWGEGRVTLLGDAAHPMTPNLGQGACQAVEDAVVLAHAIGHSRADLPAALRDYERRRIPRANRFVDDSWKMGRVTHIDSPALCALRDWSVRLTPSRVLHKSAARVGEFELE